MAKTGRPCREEAPTAPVVLRLSPRERELAEQAARANNQALSVFIREAIVTAAGDCLDMQELHFVSEN